jgi:hypothetical protein
VILYYVLQSSQGDNRPHLEVSCYGLRFSGLLDSGASCTIFGAAGIRKLESLNLIRNNNLGGRDECRVADGRNHKIQSTVAVPLKLQDRVIVLKVACVPTLPHELILGVDFWVRMGIVPDLC